MPRSTAHRGPRADALLSVLLWSTFAAAVQPLSRMFDPAGWAAPTLGGAALVLLVGFVVRRLWWGFAVPALAQIAVAVGYLTAICAGGTGLLGVIPTPATFDLVRLSLGAATGIISSSEAPIPPSPALTLVVVSVLVLAVIIFDVIVGWARVPMAAGLTLLALSIAPSLIIVDNADLLWWLLTVIGAVAMSARSAALARSGTPDPLPHVGAAMAVTAVATIAALVALPLLPTGTQGLGIASAQGQGVDPLRLDASVDLGRDLRRPNSTEVMRTTSKTPPPYMRLTTITSLNGRVWRPDDGLTAGMRPWPAPSDLTDATVRTTSNSLVIEMGQLSSRWLPVPAETTAISGYTGAWIREENSGTVRTSGGDARGQQYSVTYDRVTPQRQQIIGRAARNSPVTGTLDLPPNVPPVVRDTAERITKDARSDYEKLLALQTWFRTDFSYSLDAPVTDGYDGTSMQSLARFLEVKRGYCVHFAGAFTLMARELGMPTRIVVGFLPGNYTAAAAGGTAQYTTTSDQMHTWPEVFFEGIGWVPFEPTATLGTATAFTDPGSSANPTPGATASAAPRPTPTRGAPTVAPGSEPTPTVSAGSGGAGTGGAAPRTVLVWVALGVLVTALVLTPALIRTSRRRSRYARAVRGDAEAAWLELQDLSVDAGVRRNPALTPRTYASSLAGSGGPPLDVIQPLLDAVERARYTRSDGASDGAALVAALDGARRSWRSSRSPLQRAAAWLAPRSLWSKPGRSRAHPEAG